jgi:hypothetical protein
MREDFHFYTIYALARAAGLNPSDAHVIAYSSQYTDDEVSAEVIDFANGDSFEPRITAHSLYTLETISPRICKKVWVPFHFVPGNQGDGDDRMVTKPNGYIIQGIIKEFLEGYVSLHYSSYLLSVILHAYADTWSHQNFMGLISAKNVVKEIHIEGEANDFVEKLVAELGGEYFIPNLGHAQAASIPDEPNRKWDYIDYKGMPLQIYNFDRAILAGQSCYNLLLRFLEKSPNLQNIPPLTWQQISATIAELLGTKGNLEECKRAWQAAISNGRFGFEPEGRDVDIKYDEHEWFEAAVETDTPEVSEGEGSRHDVRYRKKDNFDNSNFKLFNDAAGAYYSSLFIKTAEEFWLDQVMI